MGCVFINIILSDKYTDKKIKITVKLKIDKNKISKHKKVQSKHCP